MAVYKMISLKAREIYEKIYYDGNGNKCKTPISIKMDKDLFEKSLKSAMPDNLDLIELKRLLKQKDYGNIKLSINNNILYSLISVSFDDNLWPYDMLYDKKDKIFVKSGFYSIHKEIKDLLKDKAIYKVDDEVIAIKTGVKTVEDSKVDLDYFEYKDGAYNYKFSPKGQTQSKTLRKELYNKGFKIKFDEEEITYVRYKRSSSEARSGNCLFIDERLFNDMNIWSYCNLPEDDRQVAKMPVEMEAYKALTLSSIEKTFVLKPENILILPDRKVSFKEKCEKVASVEKEIDDYNKKVLEVKEEEIEVENDIWDGEGLLDSEMFETLGYKNHGMLLLRNRFFKSCVFNTNLKKWFRDNNITDVSQLNQNRITKAQKLEDIKLVITFNSLKYVKFADNKNLYDFISKWWLESLSSKKNPYNIRDFDIDDEILYEFGVVKTDHKTKHFSGNLVETSYQLLNTIGMTVDEVNKFGDDFKKYYETMHKNSSVFSFYINGERFLKPKDRIDNLFESLEEDNETNDEVEDDEIDDNPQELITEDEAEKIFSNYKSKVCLELLNINDRFSETEIYQMFRKDTRESIREKAKINGHIYVHGTNATLFGNGYELLLELIGKFDGKTSTIKPGEVYSKMFEDKKELLGVRSPHITMGNLYRVKNSKHEEYDKYFNLTDEIVCVNSIGENIQQRLNGCDFDSDFMMLTDNEILIESVDRNYKEFLVPVLSIKHEEPKDKTQYKIDNKISNSKVGTITNLSQHLNSILWHIYNNSKDNRIDQELYKDICKLAILSGMEIDKAKRFYDIDAAYEIKAIRKKWLNDDYRKYPEFLSKVSNKNIETFKYDTTMTYVNNLKIAVGRGKNAIDFFEIVNKESCSNKTAYEEKANKLYDIINKSIDNTENKRTSILKSKNKEENYDNKKAYNEYVRKSLYNCYEEAIENKLLNKYYTIKLYIEKINKSQFGGKKKNNYIWCLLYILYLDDIELRKKGAKSLFEKIFKSKDEPKKLIRDDVGDIELFGYKFIEQ